MMDFDNSWNAVSNPGDANNFFDITQLPKIEIESTSYSHANAWWMSEFSRLIYRQCKQNNNSKSRAYYWNKVGMEETFFIDKENIQSAIVQPYNKSFAVVVFRGSDSIQNWITNFTFLPVKYPEGGNVHSGFQTALESIWEAIEEQLYKLSCPIFYTGHSMGGALATLAASKKQPDYVYTFGAPRVGDKAFCEMLKYVNIQRVVNELDVVTKVPLSQKPLNFCHVGKLHKLPARRNPENNNTLSIIADSLKLIEPPPFIADHAPINYTANIAKELLKP